MVGSTTRVGTFISEEKRRERDRPADRQEHAGQEKKRRERRKKERRKKKNATHHELAVGYHCQRAIETRRSRLELESELKCAAWDGKNERERRESSIYRDGSQLLCTGALAAEP